MIFSSKRKQAVSGWLKENNKEGFYASLKLQKFLFFYETLSKIDGDKSEFDYLKGYEKGPVFSEVYGDYLYRKGEFIDGAEYAYNKNPEMVNEQRAEFSSFLISILNQEELSSLTHELNIWKAKENQIKKGIKQVPLCSKDLAQEDVSILNVLRETYTPTYIDSVKVLEISDKSFVFKKEDFSNLSDEQREALLEISNDETIENPVYVNISEDGVVLID